MLYDTSCQPIIKAVTKLLQIDMLILYVWLANISYDFKGSVHKCLITLFACLSPITS
jgi:hypothetical protein